MTRTMAQRIASMFFRRKVLFLLACILLLLALAHRPWMLLFIFSARGLTNSVVFVVVGLVAVIAVHELAHLVLRGRTGSWIARRGALVFLPIALVCVNALLTVADKGACKTLGIGPFFSSNAAMYALVAVELMWITLLE